jgi:hypothetical protein
MPRLMVEHGLDYVRLHAKVGHPCGTRSSKVMQFPGPHLITPRGNRNRASACGPHNAPTAVSVDSAARHRNH